MNNKIWVRGIGYGYALKTGKQGIIAKIAGREMFLPRGRYVECPPSLKIQTKEHR